MKKRRHLLLTKGGMSLRRYHISAPMKETAIVPKGKIIILWNNNLESSFKEIKRDSVQDSYEEQEF